MIKVESAWPGQKKLKKIFSHPFYRRHEMSFSLLLHVHKAFSTGLMPFPIDKCGYSLMDIWTILLFEMCYSSIN